MVVVDDFWRRGQYRVELTAYLPYSIGDVAMALEDLGYEVSDADQWGLSYRDKGHSSRTAVLEELSGRGEYINVTLCANDVASSEIQAAENQIESIYANLRLNYLPDGDQRRTFDPRDWTASK